MTDFELERDAIVQTFLGESEEGLAVMEEVLIALEVRGDDPELLGTVFRLAHTLKGNGASLGFDGLVRFCHTLEDLLDRLRERILPVTSDLIALLLRAVDALRVMVPAEWAAPALSRNQSTYRPSRAASSAGSAVVLRVRGSLAARRGDVESPPHDDALRAQARKNRARRLHDSNGRASALLWSRLTNCGVMVRRRVMQAGTRPTPLRYGRSLRCQPIDATLTSHELCARQLATARRAATT